jgi:hypothetical protein
MRGLFTFDPGSSSLDEPDGDPSSHLGGAITIGLQ